MTTFQVIGTVVGSIVGFVLFWMFICFIISRLAGWSRIHKFYGPPPGPVPSGKSFQSGAIGLANYNNALWVSFDQYGLYLRAPWVFRFGHPRLFIPWGEVTEVETRSVLWRKLVRFRAGRTAVRILLPLGALKGSPLDPDMRSIS